MAEEVKVKIPTVDAFLRGLPWVVSLPVLALVSWLVWEPVFALFMDEGSAQFASIGVSTMGAYVVTICAMGGNWPLAGIKNPWARGIAMILLAKVLAAVFWLLIGGVFKVSLQNWAFPIIANSWLILAITSFVGGDSHLPDIPPLRRVFLNLIISVGCTLVLLRTIVIVPAQWFTFLQAIIITGGLGYFFRRVRQPVFSLITWPMLFGLMITMLAVASGLGLFSLNEGPTPYWVWNLGTGSPEFDLFFAFTCGCNFAVLACTQCWPFCRIRQPWGTPIALACVIVWCIVLAMLAGALFKSLLADDGSALWQAQVFAWHTVFWGFSWVYCFGIGQTPYLWAGQKTPGTWDDVD